jgi:hypothetical protein
MLVERPVSVPSTFWCRRGPSCFRRGGTLQRSFRNSECAQASNAILAIFLRSENKPPPGLADEGVRVDGLRLRVDALGVSPRTRASSNRHQSIPASTRVEQAAAQGDTL